MPLQPGAYNLPDMKLGAIFDCAPFYITVAGVAKDLTSCTVTMPIKDSEGTLVETLASGSGLTIDATNGIITPDLSAAHCVTTYSAGQYKYELWITEADGLDKNCYLEGRMEVRA